MRFINAQDEVSPAFAELMVKLASAYPSVRLTEIGIRVYARALDDLTLEQVRGACSRAVKECAFWPAVAELRKHIVASGEDAALLAWTALQQAAADAGAYASVELQDGASAEALVAVFGSWPQFCAEEEGPGLATKRQEFLAAYRQERRLRKAPRRLAGFCEATGQYPADGGAVWVVRIAGSAVMVMRDTQRIGEGDGYVRLALREAGVAKAPEGANEAAGDLADRGGPGSSGAV